MLICSSGVAHGATCDIEVLTRNCKLLQPADLPPDVGLFGKAIGSICPSCIYKPQKLKPKDVSAAFEYAKTKILEDMLRGRKLEDLPIDEKIIAERVAAVRGPEISSPLECALPLNAGYDPTRNKVSICPEFTLFPEASLISVFAHEIGHISDDCGPLAAHFQLDEEKLTAAESEKKISAYAATRIRHKVNAAEYINQRSLDDEHSAFLGWDKVLQQLTDLNVIKEIKPGVHPDRHPLQKSKECLLHTHRFREAPAVFNDDPEPSEEKKLRLRRLRACAREGRIKEGMADIWRARVIGKYLKENPPRSDRDKLIPLWGLANYYCAEKSRKESSPTHPDAVDRLNYIVFSHKPIREALECESANQDCAGLVDEAFGGSPTSAQPERKQGK